MSLMVKMDFDDDFGHKNWWGMSFMNQFGLKADEKNGFWCEKEWEIKRFLERERHPVCQKKEKDE